MEILLTAGIGDFIALYSFLTESEKQNIKKIYYATRAESVIKQLTPFCFPNLEKEITVCTDFTPSELINKEPENKEYVLNFCVHSKQDLIKRFPLKVEPSELKEVKDYSFAGIAQNAVDKKRNYNRPKELLDQKLSDVRFEYNEFCFIHPWSDNQSQAERDFTEEEARSLDILLQKKNIKGAVINKSTKSFYFESDNIRDFTNQFNFLDALEILKKAKYFVGSASCFSVFAAKFLSTERLFIKGHRFFKSGWHLFYYGPHLFNYFIYEDLNFLKDVR